MIETIESLLEHLYPDTPPIDILTRESTNPSIPHTREAQAMAAIAQAQRINRDSDYDCSGLCEFHIGIIYLQWRDFSGAGQQFALARRQWRFVDRQTAVCLTHFAEGYTLEANFAYETALTAYKRVAYCLPQLPESDFTRALKPELTSAHDRTRQQLASLLSPTEQQSTQSGQQTDSSTHRTHQSESNVQPAEPPISNIHQTSSQAETGTPADNNDIPIPRDNMRQTDSQINTPPPQDNMSA